MSHFSKESIKSISDTAGIKNVSDQALNLLAADVEYRIRELIQEAMKFMKHSKRNKLSTEDINHALKLRNMETIYGFSSKDPLSFHTKKASSDIFYPEDKELDFSEIINAPLPKCPREPSLRAHWLAIEGVQPTIPQNPVQPSSGLDGPESKKRKETPNTPPSGNMVVKPLVKHVLSKELQLYFEKITSAMKSNEDKQVAAAIQSLSTDPGLHLLLPYFAQYISEEVTKNLKQLQVLKALMKMFRALLENPYLLVDPYLHQLMPALLTCLVGKNLCERPEENHWELRNYCASLLAYLCKRYTTSYENMQARITKTLLQAFLDPAKPFTTHYGAIVGLTALGHHATQLLLLPNIPTYMKFLEPELESNNPQKREEARKCYNALLNAAGKYLHQASKELKSRQQGMTDRKLTIESDPYYQHLFEIFGESLIPLISQDKLDVFPL